MANKKAYLDYLESYLTEHRKELFDRVIANRTKHFTIVAEDTYQDHNASALIRTCDCFGIQDLHIIEEENKYRLAKGMTQGSDKWVDLHYYSEYEDNIQTCIDHLRAKEYQIIATTPHRNDCMVAEYDISNRSAFFFGKESTGLSEQIINQADAYVKLPMYGFSESFNISVSAALLLQELTSKLRSSEDLHWQLTEEEIVDLKIEWCIKTIQNGDRIAAKYLEEHT